MSLPLIQSLVEFEAEVCPLLYPPAPSFKSRFGMMPLAELDKPGPEIEWVIRNVITAGDKSLMAGAQQSGKSFLAIEEGFCVARGVDFLGNEVKQGLVIYQAGEGALGVKKRLRAHLKHHKLSAQDPIPFVLLTSKVNIYRDENSDIEPLIEEIKGIASLYPDDPLRIFYIDTLSKAMAGADEINGKDCARIISNIDRIREATGVHVRLVHHLNAEGTRSRGHTSLTADIDQVMFVVSDKETKIKTATTVKVKDGENDKSFKFELMQVVLGSDDKGHEITSCVVLPVGEKAELRKVDGVRTYLANDVEKLLLKALFNALSEYGVDPPSGCRVPSTVRKVVDYDRVKELYASLDLAEDKPGRTKEQIRDLKSKRLGRSRERLTANGVLSGCVIPASATRSEEQYAWFAGRPVSGVLETWAPKRIGNQPKPTSSNLMTDYDNEIPF